MKTLFVTDSHFGEKSNSENILDFLELFYTKQLIPSIKKKNIGRVIHLGDVFHNRRTINYNVLNRASKMFFAPLHQLLLGGDIKSAHFIVGNHDSYYKNTLEINSLNEYLSLYDEFDIVDDSTVVDDFLLVPWICEDNQEKILSDIKKSKQKYCLGHFELSGFDMYKGMKNEEGMKIDFSKFDAVFSGHFHTRSSKKNIHYIGAAAEYNWNDFNDPRGFTIFDDETGEIEFIQNEFNPHEMCIYDDKPIENIPEFRDKYIKLLVRNKKDQVLFDSIIEDINIAGPAEFTVIDNTQIGELSEDVDFEEITSIMGFIDEYIEKVDVASNIDRSILKNKFKTMYREVESLVDN